MLLLIVSIMSSCQARGPKKGPLVCLESVKGTYCTNWKDFKKNVSKYSLENVKIHFSPGSKAVYNLTKRLVIKNASNISLVCNCTSKQFAIFRCKQNSRSLLAITNSVSITIHNIVFNGCGNSSTGSVFGNTTFPKTTAAAIAFYNVSSVTILECIFLNSYGHGILGLNVASNFTISRVKFIENATATTNGSVHVFKGGILLYNSKLEANNDCTILIKQCYFSGIQNMWKSSLNNSGFRIKDEHLNSAVLGAVSYQNNASIKFEILDTVVANITSKHGALINGYFSINSRCSIHVTNCNFSNNSIYNNSIMNVHLSRESNSSIEHSNFTFFMTATVFQNNTAKNTIINATALGMSESKQMIVFDNIDLHHNLVEGALLYIHNNKRSHNKLTICNITVNFNSVANGSGLVLINIANSKCAGRNVFKNNTILNGSVIALNETMSIFKGKAKVLFNQASSILSIHNYTTLLDDATLNISNNFNNVSIDATILSVTVESSFKFNLCCFQFAFSKGDVHHSLKTITESVTGNANKGYKHIVSGSRLNSCYWLENSPYKTFSPGMVYKRAIHFDQMTNESNKIFQNVCMCDKNNYTSGCIADQLGTVIPGEAIHFKMKLSKPLSKSAVYIDDSTLLPNSLFTPCQITPTSPKVHLIENECTNVTYGIAVPNNAHDIKTCSLYINVVNGQSLSTRYVYYININQCFPGFMLQVLETKAVCECDPRLIKAIPGLQCSDTKFPYITRPYNFWLAYNNVSNKIQYAECHFDYCLSGTSSISLQFPDTQCLYNRTGVTCGECPATLSAIIGSSQCKICSNWWMLLLPVFLCAGLLLVLSLFLLNPTVADGKINAFILYANIMIINSSRLFPNRGIAYTILSLCNLDLGIEICFYDGMSEYGKAWLRLSFPFYLYLLVGMLAYVSRYSSRIEKITRKHVIPVIATVMLLLFTKLL